MLACAELNSAQANTAGSRIFRQFLRKNEFLSKTILACLSVTRMALILEIKKTRDTAPLSSLTYFNSSLLLCTKRDLVTLECQDSLFNHNFFLHIHK